MTTAVSRHEPIWVAAILLVLAAIAPLPLYLVALALFGLPHVLWELAWVRTAFGRRIPRWWWRLIAAILAVQAAARLGAWSGVMAAQTTAALDLLSLAMALMSGVFVLLRAPDRLLWLRLALVVALSAALVSAVHSGMIAMTLTLLAIAHNFTPLLLAPGATKLHDRPLRRSLGALFALPWLLVLAMLILGPVGPEPWRSELLAWQPSEASWLQTHVGQNIHALLSGLVLAQCLHYYSVIRLLPATASVKVLSGGWRLASVVASTMLTAYFLYDFNNARSLYAVASGVHAWLEWPLILLALGALRYGRLGNSAPVGCVPDRLARTKRPCKRFDGLVQGTRSPDR